jgi:hypothetical protein
MSIKQEVVDRVFMEVAGLLPGDWFWKPNPEGWAIGGHLCDRETGMSLYAHLPVGKDLYRIYPDAPKDTRGQIPYVVSKNLPGINVAAKKTPDAIAKDIDRRLMPEWVPLYRQAIEHIEKSNLYLEKSTSVAEEIAKVVGVELRRDRSGEMPGSISFYQSPHPIFAERTSSAEISGDSVRLELVLSADDAVALLKYMTKA